MSYLAIAAISTAVQIAEHYVRTRAAVESDLAIFSRSFAGPLGSALWSLDDDGIWSATRGLMNLPWVTGVEVLDHRQAHAFAAIGLVAGRNGGIRQLDSNGQEIPDNSGFHCCLISYRHEVVFQHEVGTTVVGYLVLYSTPLKIIDHISTAVALILFFSLVKLVALWFIFRFVFNRLLTRPLHRLADAMAAIRLDSPEATLRLSDDRGDSAEFDQLERAFNRLVDRLREEIAGHRLLRGRLEQQVAGRTAELGAAKDSAERAQQAAEQADHAKSRFLAVMSHELRTPMTGVLGLIDLLATEPLTQGQRETLAVMRSSASTLMAILNDILDYSRIDAGYLELSEEDFDLPGTVRRVVALYTPQASKKHLALHLEIAPGTCRWVKGDENRLSQILFNLISNAIKFTDAGSVTVRLESDAEGFDGIVLRCSVIDTGVGIPAEKMDHLFQPFAQLDDSRSRRVGGTGLGLVICRRLVGAMGGTIEVRSTPGVGTSFICRLRMRRGSPVERPPLAMAPQTLRPARILLAEDVDVNSRLVVEMLKRDGHVVEAVNDGAAALAAVRERRFDLVLMDLHMPGMDGLTATTCIRALGPPLGGVPVFALTADVLAQEKEEIAHAGFSGFLTKPIQWAALRQVIARAVGDSVTGVPLALPSPPDPTPILDTGHLDELRTSLGPEAFRGLMREFLNAIGTLTGRILAGLAAADPRSARQASHSLKGMAANFGAYRLTTAAAELQTACDLGLPDQGQVFALTEAAAATEAAIQRVLAPSPDHRPPA